MSKNNEKLEKDEQLIRSIQSIQRADLSIQKSHKKLITIIILIAIYPSSIAFICLGLSVSDLFLLWAVITPYGIFLINYFHRRDKKRRISMVFVQEIKELLYTIHFLINMNIKSSIEERFNLLNKFKKELKNIHCYLIEKENIPTLLIYTSKGKYEANKDNIKQIYPYDKGAKSILNQDNPINFINSIIDELKKNI